MIYFDQAASSWPKPKSVAQAMVEAVTDYGANPGRGGHTLAAKASGVIRETRSLLAELFHVQDPRNIIFFTNATQALNQALKGFKWQAGDRVITTSYEHNSVRRPLEFLHQQYGVEVIYVQHDRNGAIQYDKVEELISPNTKLIVATHVSNLTGVVLPIEEIGRIAQRKRVPFLVDASQSAGFIEIDVQKMGISMLAFPGHKGLYGPQGTGGLYISPDIDLIPLVHGGTGSHSEQIEQPVERPGRYESGTLNTPGIAGLGAGVKFLMELGVEHVYQHEQELVQYAVQQLNEVRGLQWYGPDLNHNRAPVVAFNLIGIDPQELAHILDQHYQIATRAGLHCTPLGHESIGTIETGAVRASFGYFNTRTEIDRLVLALQEIRVGMLGE